MILADTAARETAAALRAVRQQWGDMLLAIETPPAADWPPRQLAQTLRPVADEPHHLDEVEQHLGRAPLVLREHPAPLNLDALDAALAVERMIFGLADTLAAAVQRAELGDDPRLWTPRREHGPGSRAHGLHWAAVWVEGRTLDEDTEPEYNDTGRLVSAPFAPLPGYLVHEAHRVARQCERLVLRTLGLDERDNVLPGRPCPWCGGELVAHTGPDTAPTITCSTGEPCPAPVTLDARGRRVWGWPAVLDLVHTLDEVEQHEASQAA